MSATRRPRGKLAIGFWDHWVPGANNAIDRAVRGMGREEEGRGLDRLHHLAGQQEPADHRRRGAGEVGPRHPGVPDLGAAGARQQPRAGRRHHDGADQAERQRSTRRSSISASANGKLGRGAGHRRQPDQGPCSRIDLMKKHAGIDVQAMYPAGSRAEGRRLDARTPSSRRPRPATRAATRSASASARPRTTSTRPARSSSRSAPQLVDAKGNITVKSDAVRQALEYYKKLAQLLPPDAPAWDDASNNKCLVSGKGALIMNPPSAWAVAKRDAPQVAEQCWTHGMPSGPNGPLRAVPAVLLGHLELRQEQAGGQEPARCTCRSRVGGREDGGGERRLRPAGVREAHRLQGLGRGRAAEGHALPLPEPAQPPDPVGRRRAGAAEDRPPDLHPGDPDQDGRALIKGEPMEKTLAWAESELEGFMRT